MSSTHTNEPVENDLSSFCARSALQISLLGEFSLWQRGEKFSLDTPSYQSLLAYLVSHPQHAHTRQQLAFTFWPDSSESQARTNLRKALYTLRQTLPDADVFLAADRQAIQWRPDAPCLVDVWDFEIAVALSQQTESPIEQQTCLEQAIDSYHGDFMPGHFDDWILTTREKLLQQYLTALEKLLVLHENQREYPTAITLARKLLREDPLHELAYRRLMRLQSLNGDPAGALRTYHACSTRLRQELGVGPGPVTQEAYERLLSVKAPPAPMAPTRLPLVAREQAWQKLQSAWKRCSRDQAGVALISGEAGIGKTRLAEELLDWAERQGIVVLKAHCYPSEKQLAYAPVAEWLRSEPLQPVFGRLGKRQLVECSRLLPELHELHPDLPDPEPMTEGWQRQHLFSSLAQTLLQLRQPVLLFIDDLPWCDQDSLDWLHYLLQFEPRSRFMLLSAARSEEITVDHPLITWQQELDRDGRLSKIRLERMNAGASARLAGHVLQKDLDSFQTARLYAETEGNPLFVVEMARVGLDALHIEDQLHTLSPKVHTIIETRLASLTPPSYQLAQLAAVIGRSFSFNLLNQACAQSEDSLIRNLDEMWQRRIVREHGAEAYDFSHDKLRQVAYESLSQARRRQMHIQVWQALETLHTDDLDPVSSQIAAHCEAAGYYQEAIVHYQRAARVAQAVFANQDTLDFLQRAIDLFPQAEASPQQQLKIYEQQGDVLTIIGRYEEAEAAFGLSVPFTKEPVDQSRIHRKIANTRQLRRQHDKAFEAWQISEDSLGSLSADWSEAYWQEWLRIQLDKSWVLYWTNRLADLESLLKEIHPIVEERGTTFQQGLHYQRLVLLSFRRDRFVLGEETLKYAQRSFAMIQESGTLNQIAFSQFALGLAFSKLGWEGDFEEAVYHMKSALGLARELGDVVLQIRCLIHLSDNYLRQGDLDSVESYLPEAMTLAETVNILEYVLVGKGLHSWYAWYKGNFVESQKLGEHAIELSRDLPFGWPEKWVVVFPLISITLMHTDVEKAIAYARLPLEPDQMRLHDELTATLHKAVDSWEDNQPHAARAYLQQALQLAQKYHYL